VGSTTKAWMCRVNDIHHAAADHPATGLLQRIEMGTIEVWVYRAMDDGVRGISLLQECIEPPITVHRQNRLRIRRQHPVVYVDGSLRTAGTHQATIATQGGR